MKAVQVLTDESIEKIENAIEVLKAYSKPNRFSMFEAIKDLEEILKDVKE